MYMDPRLSSAKIVGNPSELRWSQVVEHTPDPETSEARLGSFYAAVSLAKKDESTKEELIKIGKEIMSSLQESYYKSDKTPFEAVGHAVYEVSQKYSFSDISAEISCGSIYEGVAYVSSYSGGEVHLLRRGALSKIVSAPYGESKTASGKLSHEDMLIFSTPRFFLEVDKNLLETAQKSKSAEEFSETLASVVHAGNDAAGHALIVVQIPFGQKHVDEVVSPVEDEKTVEEAISDQEAEIDMVFEPQKPSFFERFRNTSKAGLGRKLFIKRGEVEVEESQRRRSAVTVGLILLVLLSISIVFGLFQKNAKEAQSRYGSKVAEVEHNLEEAKTLFMLNPARARELFAISETLLSKLKEEYGEDDRIAALSTQIDEGRSGVLGEYDTAASEFVDLSLIDGFEAEKMAGALGAVYIYDGNKRRVVEVEVDTKGTEVKAGPTQLNSVEAIASYAGLIYVADNDGVFGVGSARVEVLEKDWEGSILLEAYAGNIYLLEKSSSSIWRYPGLQGSFGDRASWLAPGIDIDLSKIVSWAVDGDIWILSSSGNVEKYSFGSPEDFDQATVVPGMEGPISIYTNEELDNIYVLDPPTSRVVVFDKGGGYVAQYNSQVMREAKGVYASEKEGKILVLTKEKLYSIEIEE